MHFASSAGSGTTNPLRMDVYATVSTYPDIEQPLELNLQKFVHSLDGYMHLMGVVQQPCQ